MQPEIGAHADITSADIITPKLMVVAWELTRSCNLSCAHCRGSAGNEHYPDELSTAECYGVIDQIVSVGNPILILTGGEPLVRPDIYEIGACAVSKGLRVVMGTNGTIITPDAAARLKGIPVSRVGVSLDFPDAEGQDRFRGRTGAFDAAVAGIRNARAAGIEVQINSTITRLNIGLLDRLLALALDVGAVAFHPFFLVPTGRGKSLEALELPPEQYEEALNWVYDKQLELGDRMFFKPTDVPHYMRIAMQRGKEAATAGRPGRPAGHGGARGMTRGCLAGTGFCFISYRGRMKGCGYLDIEAGDIRTQGFREVWMNSPLFRDLRDLSGLKGKCGSCEYKRICGGCRARAYEATGDHMEAEPYCVYQPRCGGGVHGHG